jgi:hypothetical protein
MYDITNGQSYTVSCGGMRATTTVRTTSNFPLKGFENILKMMATAMAVAFIVYSCKGKLKVAEKLESCPDTRPDGGQYVCSTDQQGCSADEDGSQGYGAL